MKLIIAFAAVIALLLCLPVAASACPPATQAAFGAGYGASCAAPVSSFGAAGYGAMAAPVVAMPMPTYGMAHSFGAAAPLYGGFSGAAFGGPVVHVVHTRPGLFGRIHAAHQAFHRGF